MMAVWKCSICGERMDYSKAKAHMLYIHMCYTPSLADEVIES